MTPRQPLLHEVLKALVESMTFPVTYSSVVDNTDGTYTLRGICNIHHAQPGFDVTIDGDDYSIKDYGTDDEGYYLLLENTLSNPLPAAPNTFNLYTPFFFHGHPIQQSAELDKIKMPKAKTPMAYLMEPYDIKKDNDWDSSIDSRSNVTLCFVTLSLNQKWRTDDIYHKAVNPMVNLMNEFIEKLIASNLFYTDELKSDPTYHVKFGINIRESGTKKNYFAEELSGVSVDLFLQMYKIESCECLPGASAMPSDCCAPGAMGIKEKKIFIPNGTGDYGALLGTIDGANDIFTIDRGKYEPGRVTVTNGGIPQIPGVDFTEFNPATGKIKFLSSSIPVTGDNPMVVVI